MNQSQSKQNQTPQNPFYVQNRVPLEFIFSKCIKTLSRGALFPDEEACAKNITSIWNDAELIVSRQLNKQFN